MQIAKFILTLILFTSFVSSCKNSSYNSNIVNAKNEDVVNINNRKPNATKTIIVDVRTVEEWNNDGHNNCSVNYPLDELESRINSLKQYDKIILTCRTGNRANTAKAMLEKNGVSQVENIGSWRNIDCK